MSWEIESEHIYLAEMQHVTVFVERGVKTRSGDPARHLLQIRLGDHLQLDDQGNIVDGDGNVYDHRAKQLQIMQELNALHGKARAFARKHGVPIYKGPER